LVAWWERFDMLLTLRATAAGVLVGLFNVVTGRGGSNGIQLKPGDPAPDFELPGSDGGVYRLRDFRNRERVVIAWFPKAFTGGCTKECQSIGRSGIALRGCRARYFGASVDSPETNRRFAEAMGIDYPILSDEDRRVARAYGVLGSTGFASRWTFYIGEDGRILDIDKDVRVVSHGADVAVRLKELGAPCL
jgi:peroxiredoxin Q/BCP